MPAVETNRGKVLSRLAKDGWVFDRHGSEHDIYRHPTKQAVISLPRHRTISLGVARSISKAAGWH